MTVNEWRRKLIQQLSPTSDSPRTDAELLLIHATDKTRTQLFAEANAPLTTEEEIILSHIAAERATGVPMAYILGVQPFWTLDLIVTEDTLIPRPETECLVEWVLTHIPDHPDLCVADIGTGTGAIAIAIATEKPNWKIDASDESYEALAIAKKNIVKHHIKNVSLYQGDWFAALPDKKYDVIITNPPYIAENDPHLAKLTFEPQMALVSGSAGLDAIAHIAAQASAHLKAGGHIVIEHGFDQGDMVADMLKQAGFVEVTNHHDLADIPRFVTGKYPA